MVYESRKASLEQNAQEFIMVHLQVIPVAQEKYKPIWVDEPKQDYYHLVTLSDKTFGFFCLKNYIDFTSYSN